MTDQPDIVSEIADLLGRIRSISHPAAADPTIRAELLARKADLLARIVANNTNRWTGHHAEQARQVAQQAQAAADQARDLADKAHGPTLDQTHEPPCF
ncbi:MAG: hypothetical protein L0Y54_19660 [Sporichthyaceae bacterium]|nr:hypothetical protein [Sporichthyaceae bacterium]